MSSFDPSLPLAELSEPVRVHSRSLGQNLWIVPDGCAVKGLKGAVYTVSECLLLVELAPGPGELAAIHLAKVHLDADLVRGGDSGD